MEALIIALMGAGGGGIALKVIEYFLGKRTRREDFAAKIRDELRADLQRQDAEIEKLWTRVESLATALKEEENKHKSTVLAFQEYKLSVYKLLVEHQASKELVDAVLALNGE